MGLAWRGQELFEQPGWSIRLSLLEFSVLRAFAESNRSDGLEDLNRPKPSIPELADTVAGLADELEMGTGAVLVKGLDISGWDLRLIEAAYWGFASQLGTPVSQSAEGRRLFPVRDAGYSSNDPGSRTDVKQAPELPH